MIGRGAILFLLGLLPAFGSPTDIPNPISTNPLHWAARANNLAEAKAILAKDPSLLNSVDHDHRNALHYAAAASSIDVLRFLISRKANVDQQSSVGVTPLMWAMEFQDLDGFKLLLAAHPNLELARHETLSFTPLAAAAWDGRTEYAKLLLDAGANPNVRDEDGWTPLLRATYNRAPIRLIALLLDHGARVDARNNGGNASLSHALRSGDAGVAKLLLERGADIRITGFDNRKWHDNSQMNSAGWSALGGDPECLHLALAYGADPRLRDGEGRDALQIAREHNHPTTVALIGETLLKLGQGWTSRHFAVEYGIREALLRPGPDLDAQTEDGTTPLMIAAIHGDVEAIRILLRGGAHADLKNRKGETALDLAIRRGDRAAAALLRAG